MGARSRSSVTAALAVLLVAACGTDPATTSQSARQTATTSPSAVPNTTIATTTTMPPTTSSTTTLPTTSVPTVIPAGWSQIDMESVSS